MRLAVSHITHYRFSESADHGLQRLRLRPKATHGQNVLDWQVTLDGLKREAGYEDHNHNTTLLVSVLPGTLEVTVSCSGTVETADNAGIIGQHAGHMPLWAFLAQTRLTRPGARMRAIAGGLDSDRSKPLECLHSLSRAVRDAVTYEIGHTDASTSAEDALVAGHGVCQDHAHVFIGTARLIGIPARYVSGYLMMDDRIDQEAGHAWAEAHIDGLGWVGFDVSNGICPDQRYIRVATGRDYFEAAPVAGVIFGAGEAELAVSLAVEQRLCGQ